MTRFTKQGGQPTFSRQSNERERLLFVAAAGLAFSLLVILLVVFNFRTEANARQDAQVNTTEIPAAIGTVTLFTPDRHVRAGTKLSNVLFKEIYWPRDQVPEEAVRDIAEVREMYAKTDLPPGTPLRLSSVTTEPSVYTLPLTPGNRAVTIEVDATAGLEGYALPGTRVDVVLTYQEPDGNLTSKVIVQNARVLSYGGDRTHLSKRVGIASVQQAGRTITLDVAPPDALKIQTSRQLGRLSLLLRSPEDDRPYRTTEVDRHVIDGGSRRRTDRTSSSCRKGVMRMDGKEYVIDCDGSISELVNTDEP